MSRSDDAAGAEGTMSRSGDAAAAPGRSTWPARLRRIAVPVAVYVAITLALPAANGAWARAGFFRHAAWVLAGCAAAVATSLVLGLAGGGARVLRGRAANAVGRSHSPCHGGRK